MSVNHTIPEPRAGSKPEFLLIRRADLDDVLSEIERARELALPDRPGINLSTTLGHAHGLVRSLYRDNDDEPPLSIYDEPPDDLPEAFCPDPDEQQWAAENVAPCTPRTPESLMGLLADTLESIGLEPLHDGRAIDIQFAGRDYELRLTDLTDYFAHMDEAMRGHYGRTRGLTEGEAQALAAGLPLG